MNSPQMSAQFTKIVGLPKLSKLLYGPCYLLTSIRFGYIFG
jgi:hypothetical protein